MKRLEEKGELKDKPLKESFLALRFAAFYLYLMKKSSEKREI